MNTNTARQRKNAAAGILFVLPSLTGLAAFVVVPFAVSLYYAFTQGISQIHFVGFTNFTDLIGNPAFTQAMGNTLLFIGVGVPSALALALAFSLLMADKRFVFERWAMLAPLIVPIATVIIGWRYLLSDGGPAAGLLGLVNARMPNLFSEPYAMAFIIILYVWKNTGYLLVLFTSAISVLPREYREVFALESKSGIRYALRVVLPLIMPVTFFAVIIAIMNSFKIFREIYVLFGDTPPRTIYMLQHFMNNNFLKLNYQRLSSAAFLLAAGLSVLIGLFLEAQRRYNKRV
jgi:multiple sugar transport system permease protein